MTSPDASVSPQQPEAKPKIRRLKQSVSVTLRTENKDWADKQALNAPGGARSRTWFIESLIEADRKAKQQASSEEPWP